MRRRLQNDWTMAVRLLSALALILVAFAHAPLNLRAVPDAAAYAFPDGSIPVICVTLPRDDGSPGVSHGSPCDACLISGSIVVPVPADLAGPVVEPSVAVTYLAPTPPVLHAAWPPAAPPQAPPIA